MKAESKAPAAVKHPIITLTTDFGSDSYQVGAMKGAICEVNPLAKVVDISHELPPFDLLSGAFTIRACYYDFPLHTVHVVAVDPGNGPKRRPLLVKTENYYFLAPDNGVLSFIYECETIVAVVQLEATHYFRRQVNPAFLARDVYAAAAGHLVRLMDYTDFGSPVQDFARIPIPKPQVSGNQMKAFVLLADRFGNLITNIETADLKAFMQQQGFKGFRLAVGSQVAGPLARSHGEGQGEFFPILGGSGYLEIAARQKSAQQLLNAQRGQECVLQFE